MNWIELWAKMEVISIFISIIFLIFFIIYAIVMFIKERK